MGLDTVWQLLGWVSFTYGATFAAWSVLPSEWYGRYKKEYGSRGSFALPMWIILLCWLLLDACLSLASFWVHGDNNWDSKPIPLFIYVFTVIVTNLWMTYYFLPGNVGCYDLSMVICTSLCGSIATMVYFFDEKLISGLLVIPLVVWLGYNTLLTFDYEHRSCGFNFIDYDDHPTSDLLCKNGGTYGMYTTRAHAH